MSKYGCDHVDGFVTVGDLTILNEKSEPVMGILIVCHYCGLCKEVYEDGTVITREKR